LALNLVGRVSFIPTTIIGREGLEPFDARIEIIFLLWYLENIYIYRKLSSEKSVN
jgi:hypothetical protein